MKTVRILPTNLVGEVNIPSSKSMGHREIICAGLAQGVSIVDNISMSKDIEATCRCLKALGVRIEQVPSRYEGRTALKITGSGELKACSSSVDCGESGSTLRFFIPLMALLGSEMKLIGHGKLVSRPLQAYYDIFDEQKLYYTTENGQLPLTVNGRLRPGKYTLPGDVSSQFVSGLLFALPLLEGDSELVITSPLESSSYVDLTLSCLKKYGILIENHQHQVYKIKGGQKYLAQNSIVEGDWSQAAFWLAGGCLGGKLTLKGMDLDSLQGDKAVLDIMQKMNCRLQTAAELKAEASEPQAVVIDASNCPDIIPVLTVLAAVSTGTTKIINAARLRIKECDRLAAMTQELNKIGADITELEDGLIINGRSWLKGDAQVDAWNDHRVAMSLAIAAVKCKAPIILTGAESVQKSYPDFWQDYQQLGGKTEVLA